MARLSHYQRELGMVCLALGLAAVPCMLVKDSAWAMFLWGFWILLMLVLGSGNITTLVIAMSLTGWMGSARSTRGLVLQLKGRDFVVASRTLGAPAWWIIIKRLIPNTLGIRVVSITMSIPSAIFYEAFLSYIGLGVTPPAPSWGQLIKEASTNFRYYPYQFIIPCAVVGLTMLCFNLVGDGLRDALDPRLRS